MANAGSDVQICGPEYQLQAIPSVGNGYWDIPAGIEVTGFLQDPEIIVQVPDYTTWKFKWTETNWKCVTSDEVSVEFFEKTILADAGPDQELDFLTHTILHGILPPVGEGNWTLLSGNADITNANDALTEVSSLDFGENWLLWTVTNGVCPPASDSILIKVNDLFIPNGISPGVADNKNDLFIIKGIENTISNELTIVNRWGETVWHTKNYNNNWRGTNENADDLPPDTYYYILNVNNNKIYKGFIVVK